eukprot:gnl/MRDRNA2_/MRDRNA2_37793_c0_seq1.p1 gnl/MRDRNA2_/MRDRNA2_37793_c0~~gnl/MRDRNA2_/MRDRNA2_37793_c0_seq1.p1  ORF type:complete len:213 (+),score=43.08 gnl/MRDRNA2_/MRDRNA2_37793_c0_seq1:81-641(+)
MADGDSADYKASYKKLKQRYEKNVDSFANFRVLLRNMITDYLFACPSLRAAALLRRQNSTAYLYRFEADDFITEASGAVLDRKALGAHHLSEVFFLFRLGNALFGGGAAGFGLKLTDADQVIATEMQKSWAHLASGEEPWTAASARVFSLSNDGKGSFKSDADLRRWHQCDFWDVVQKEEAHQLWT